MSKYLKSPDNMLTSSWLESIAQSYILNELRSSIRKNIFPEMEFVEDNEKALIQKMLDNSNFSLRMYGSADELAQNLKIYQNFPGSQQFFKTKFEPYTTTATIYRSLKDEEYICKSDLFVILQNMALDVFPETNSISVRVSISSALHLEQNKIPHRMEFIKFDQKMFDEIEMEMREAGKLFDISNSELAVLAAQLEAGNFDSLVAKFQKVNVVKRDSNEIRENLKHFYNIQKAPSLNPLQNPVVFLICISALTCLQKIIAKRLEMFQPSSINKTPMIVRLFEDGNQQFVMESELAIAMRPEKASEIIVGRGKVGFHSYSTITLDEALRKGVGRVEFIRYPIKRTKHRAVPIEGPDPEDSNDWCILAVDAFFELMKSIITGFKIFQNDGTSGNLSAYFKFLFSPFEKIFKPEEKSPYFLQIESINYLLTTLQSTIKSVRPTKDVRNAKKDGFTVQNLKNELNHLNLTAFFPEIFDYAEDVYEEIDKAKKERYLRTCDLFDAVENCQLICVLHRVPNLKKFLHNQKGCGKVLGYKCEHCDEERKTPDELEVSHQPAVVQKTSDIQNSMKNLKILSSNEPVSNLYSQPALLAPKGCDECSESSTAFKKAENELKLSQDQVTEMEKELSDLKKEHEKIVESEAKKMDELTEIKKELNREKEKNMEKEDDILKASKENEELQKTNLKLTAENQQKITKTEKELSDLKKGYEKIVESEAKKTEELVEMKEELNNEKEKNQEKEEEILKASKKIEELEKANLKLTAENEANERMIQKLLDRISNSSTNNQKTNEIKEKTIEELTPTTSVTSKNAPLVIDCLICSSQIKSGQEVIRCPLCKRRFHSDCAFKWRKDHTQCPACNGDLPGI